MDMQKTQHAGATILVADDDPLVLKSVTFILVRAGYDVHTATDGAAALELVRELRPRLCLLDVMMPHMDGLDVVRAIRADDELRETPVFLVTARAMASERQVGLEAGADDYITKPFVNRALLERVEEALSGQLAPGEPRH